MNCSTSIRMHLLRGGAAIACLSFAFFISPMQPILMVMALISAMLFLRGCPICWLMDLVGKLKSKRFNKLSNKRE